MHLHSCSEEVARSGEVAGALAAAATAGKVRVAAYSGENAAIDAAVASGAFGAIELSASPWDRAAIDRVLWRAKDRGMGADCAVAGTTSAAHLRALVEHVADGPLPGDVGRAVREAWWRRGAGWPGVV